MPLPARDTARLLCPLATPLAGDGRIDHGRLARHALRLLEDGLDGVVLFGTTGQGQAFSAAERRAALEALLAAGVAPGQVMVASAAAAFEDSVALTRHALELGCADVLVLPFFMFRPAPPEGVVRFYAELATRAGSPGLRLHLYHLPAISGIAVTEEIVEAVQRELGGALVGYKDSSGDLAHTRALLARFPDLAIRVGSETDLATAVAEGAAGGICGLANLAPRLLRRLIEAPTEEDGQRIAAFGAACDALPFVPAVHALLARLDDAPSWRACRLPLLPPDEAAEDLLAEQALELCDATPLSGTAS
ncbi:dihydrodipicolinate synthase family protein [Geminicoccaceae bacterium 1502E]|nr:dihydrodipicolinate synthase family protein [Geminicoccaceae bacterium 1502E]